MVGDNTGTDLSKVWHCCYSFDIYNKQFEILVEIVAVFPLIKYHKDIGKAAACSSHIFWKIMRMTTCEYMTFLLLLSSVL